MILLLHTLVEGIIGLLFLFYPAAGALVPGFAAGEGDSYVLLMKMYGVAALFLAGISLLAYVRKDNTTIFLFVTLTLSVFHYVMIIVQTVYNFDQRGALLHFLLAIFLTAQYLGRRKQGWDSDRSLLN